LCALAVRTCQSGVVRRAAASRLHSR
jgi:hypothetical protein